ncbi:probable G-protein coupled receptor Mth-like 11 [Drosophila kikkawai]|uniref:Probable G-protein coupled receptor Mth-like 11 n=1 Tax=Drosophila kikkawai TaxID=30033 RepID=A0ABM4GJS7_DROKI
MSQSLCLFTICCSILLVGIKADIADCDYFDTVDLKRGFKFENGSYRYEDLIVPAHLTGEYDYKVTYDGDREPVPKHIRGCVCKLRPCIRLCCHSKKIMESDGTGCSADYINETLSYDYTLNVTLKDGTVLKRHILKDIILQEELPLPCQEHYSLNQELSDDDKWTLFDNGTLFRHYDQAFLSKQDYCLQPQMSGNGTAYSLAPYNCIIQPSLTMGYVKLVSVVFLAITIALYLWLPRFHSLHGMCSVLYFVCLMATFLLNVISMFRLAEEKRVFCLINGYAGYFMAMATFLWLSAISFDVWRHFGLHSAQIFQSSNRSMFLVYNLIAWSLAGFLTLVIFLVDQYLDEVTGYTLLPGVGMYSCWINTDSWSGMLYFYLPIAILISFNIIMYILTSRHIYEENKSRTKVLSKFEEKQQSRNRDNFGLYLYLFIIMGGSWLLEILAFICELEDVWKPFVTVNEIINSSQGIIIFLVTICNKELLRDIRDRILGKRTTGIELETCNMTQDYPLMQQGN